MKKYAKKNEFFVLNPGTVNIVLTGEPLPQSDDYKQPSATISIRSLNEMDPFPIVEFSSDLYDGVLVEDLTDIICQAKILLTSYNDGLNNMKNKHRQLSLFE